MIKVGYRLAIFAQPWRQPACSHPDCRVVSALTWRCLSCLLVWVNVYVQYRVQIGSLVIFLDTDSEMMVRHDVFHSVACIGLACVPVSQSLCWLDLLYSKYLLRGYSSLSQWQTLSFSSISQRQSRYRTSIKKSQAARPLSPTFGQDRTWPTTSPCLVNVHALGPLLRVNLGVE